MFDNVVQFFQGLDWVAILTIVIGAGIARWVAGLLVKSFLKQATKTHRYVSNKERQQRLDTLVSIFTTIITTLIALVAFALLLVQLGADLAAIAASLGALGVVLGIASQSVLKSGFRGISIILGNHMRIGDIVELGGVSGVVEQLNLLNTRLRDLDGTLHIVPNGEIIVLTNFSMGFANVNLDLRVSYDSDIEKVIKLVNDLGNKMAADEEWSGIIKEPIQFLRVDSFGESGVNIRALGKVSPGEQWGTAGEFRKRILIEFAKAGIEVPLPQMVVRNKDSKKDAES